MLYTLTEQDTLLPSRSAAHNGTHHTLETFSHGLFPFSLVFLYFAALRRCSHYLLLCIGARSASLHGDDCDPPQTHLAEMHEERRLSITHPCLMPTHLTLPIAQILLPAQRAVP